MARNALWYDLQDELVAERASVNVAAAATGTPVTFIAPITGQHTTHGVSDDVSSREGEDGGGLAWWQGANADALRAAPSFVGSTMLAQSDAFERAEDARDLDDSRWFVGACTYCGYKHAIDMDESGHTPWVAS